MARGRIITLPDMQYENRFCPQWMEAMFDHCIARQPDLVLCMGDMMEDPSVPQLERLRTQFGRLAGAGIRALPLLGNHDYSDLGARVTPVNDYLSPPAWAVPYQAGHVENVYVTLTLSGRAWIVFALEWAPRRAVVDWVKGVLDVHAGTPAIVVTHGYLYFDGSRYDYQTYGPGDPRGVGAHYLQESTPSEGPHDGGDLWRELVGVYPQIRMVLCGHSSDPLTCNRGAACSVSARSDGTVCYELLQDFQEYEALGGSWLTEIELDDANGRLLASTYSPQFQEYRYPSAVNPNNGLAFNLPLKVEA